MLRRLFRTSSFDKFRESNAGEIGLPAFHAYITELCAKRGVVREHIIKDAGLDRVYGHQIFAGRHMPSRDKVLQLAFAFGMGADEAQHLLRLARKPALYPRVERDAALLFCLNRRMRLIDAQEMLSDRGLTALGGDKNDA